MLLNFNQEDVRNMYLIGYGVIGILQSVFIFSAIVMVTFATIQASISLHNGLLNSILRSPMSFFDTTPLGRIVNRFSKDIDEIDMILPLNIKNIINQIFSVIGVIVIISIVTPRVLLALIPLMFGFFFIQRVYIKTSRQLKRLFSINRSPIFSHLGETLNGITTIRAYCSQDEFIRENENKIETMQMSKFYEIQSNSWVMMRLQIVVTGLIFSTALAIVLDRYVNNLSKNFLG